MGKEIPSVVENCAKEYFKKKIGNCSVGLRIYCV